VTLDFAGSITTDPSAMTVFTFVNGFDVRVNATMLEGGIFDGWEADRPYRANYLDSADVARDGGQEAICIQGVFGCELNLRAYGYAGRLLRTTERSDQSHPPTGAFSGRLETGRHSNLQKARVAQVLWADSGTEVGTGNWGSLERVVCDFDYFPPVWTNLNDIEIATFDCAFAVAGPEFRGCVVVEGNYWYIGDLDGGNPSNHITFKPSSERQCEALRVSRMRFLNRGVGLYVDGASRFDFSLDHSSGHHSPLWAAAQLNDARNGSVTVTASGYGERLILIGGADSDNLRVTPIDQNFLASENMVEVSEDVHGLILIDRPFLQNVLHSKARIAVRSHSQVIIDTPVFLGEDGAVFDLVDGNQVFVRGSFHRGEAILARNSPPRHFSTGSNDAAGMQDLRINAGSNTHGDGGEITFGIGLEAFSKSAPMAILKSKLSNATDTELQGGLSMQFRHIGNKIYDGFEVSGSMTENETVGVLLTVEDGRYVPKRIKMSEPDPVNGRRLLYVDGPQDD
jgi:hypothetical protein